MSEEKRAEEKPDAYVGAQADVLELIVGESDKRISAQVQLMLANDSRANGILAASATLGAAGYAVAGAQLGIDGNIHLLIGAGAFALLATFATLAALWALWPIGVDIQGWSPRLFIGDVTEKKDLHQLKADVAALNQEKIRGNDKCNKDLSKRIRVAMSLLVAAPIVGALALLVSSFLP